MRGEALKATGREHLWLSLAAEASSMYGFESESPAKRVIPNTSNAGNEILTSIRRRRQWVLSVNGMLRQHSLERAVN